MIYFHEVLLVVQPLALMRLEGDECSTVDEGISVAEDQDVSMPLIVAQMLPNRVLPKADPSKKFYENLLLHLLLEGFGSKFGLTVAVVEGAGIWKPTKAATTTTRDLLVTASQQALSRNGLIDTDVLVWRLLLL